MGPVDGCRLARMTMTQQTLAKATTIQVVAGETSGTLLGVPTDPSQTSRNGSFAAALGGVHAVTVSCLSAKNNELRTKIAATNGIP